MKLHFFDLDRTLCVKNVSFSFYFYLLKEGVVPFSSLFKTIPLYVRRLSLEQIHYKLFSHLLKGLFFSTLERQAERFLKKELPNLLCPTLFPYVEQARKRGEKIFLLSSSPLYLVEKIARECGFDQCAGTEYGIDKEGKICEITSLITGLEKRKIASLWADGVKERAETVAYSDSQEDLPLLEWADTAILIRPCRRLKKVAQGRKWKLIQEE